MHVRRLFRVLREYVDRRWNALHRLFLTVNALPHQPITPSCGLEDGKTRRGDGTMTCLTRRKILAGLGAGLCIPGLVGRASAQALPRSINLTGAITRGEHATVTRVRTATPVVAMTFDDGPHSSLTPQLLDILSARGIRATFYVIGNRVSAHPLLMQRMVAEGHEIGNHTWSHPSLFGYSDAGVLDQLDRTAAAVHDAVGSSPVTMRPPYGHLYGRQRLMVHQARNLPTVLWSVDPQDWRRPGSAAVANHILDRSRPGDVILAHDIHVGTVRAMPAALDGLIARGYRFATVSELVGWPSWDTRTIRRATRAR